MGFIRLLLALSVVAAHCGKVFGLGLVDSRIAVEAFYIVSGFYMALIINEKYVGVNGSYRLFITNRLMRLYPLYWVVLVLSLLRALAIIIVTHGESLSMFANYLKTQANVFTLGYLIATQILIFGQDLVMFMGIDTNTGSLYLTADFWQSTLPAYRLLFIPQAWTLGLEFTFYLVAPFILKRRLSFVLTMMAGSLLLRLFLFYNLHLNADPWTFRFFPTELVFFLAGYVSYRIYRHAKNVHTQTWKGISVLILLVLFTAVYKHLPNVKLDYFPFSVREICYLTFISISIPLLFRLFRENEIDNAVGDLSYPVYIIHNLVYVVFEDLPFSILHSGSAVAIASIAASYVLNRVISSPVEKYRQSRLVDNTAKPGKAIV